MSKILDDYLPIGIIGSGNIGTAILSGLIAAKIISPESIIATKSQHKQLNELQDKGIVIESDNNVVAEKSKILILAVKPNLIHEIVKDIKSVIHGKLIISVAAGVTINSIEEITEGSVIRVVLNTAVKVREGCAAISRGKHASDKDLQVCKAIMESVCKVSEIVAEENIDSMIGISGSGIAFMYVVAEALTDAGVKMGLPREISKNFVAQTMIGAGKMIQKTGEHPMQLKDKVTSPGGTTICGIAKLEELGLRNALIKAAEAAKERAQQL